MKKWIALLLAALMLMTGAAGMAAQGDALLGHDDNDGDVYFRYCFTDGDTLYLDSYDSLYTYRVGDADMTRYDYEMPADESEDVNVVRFPFLRDGRLYGIELYTSYDEYAEFIKAQIAAYELIEGKVVTTGEAAPIDWTDFVQYYERDAYPVEPQGMVQTGNKLFFRYYSDQGDRMWAVIDLDAMRVEELPDLSDAVSMVPYRDGMLLLQMFNYNQNNIVRFQLFDPDSESLQPLSEIEVPDYATYDGMAYDASADALYCVRGGEVCALDVMTGELSEGITDMPLDAYGEGTACILRGGYYAYGSSGADVRNLDPSQRAQSRLKIFDGAWADSVTDAYYQFSNAHGDVTVVLSHDEAGNGNIIENMMNRDSSIDIYVLSCASSDYEAVHNRGYMMELDNCQGVTALADSMYPAVREALSFNGHLVALPVEAYSWTLGVNEKVLDQLGLKLEDVPTNWSDFLDFLNELPNLIPADSSISVFYPENTVEDLRAQLFYLIFDDYQNYVNATDPAIGYNTDLLRGLLDKLDNVDFEALGFEHADDSDDHAGHMGGSWTEGEESKVLFESSTGCTFGNFYSEATPVLMSMDAQTPRFMVLQAMVAFVNPFTRYPEQALAFMDQLAASLNNNVRYTFIPELDEPIRGEYNEKYMKEIQDELADLNAQLESASEKDKQSIEETIRDWESNLAYMERDGWDIAPRHIEWFRANDDNIVLMGVNWVYSEESGEAYELINQYREGRISAREMLEGIDKKVQMMLLEGH